MISLLVVPAIAAVPEVVALNPSTENSPSIDSSHNTLPSPLNELALMSLALPVTPVSSIPEEMFSPILRPSICKSTCLAQIPGPLHVSNSTPDNVRTD